jgi:polyhydroxyalkanoate synthase
MTRPHRPDVLSAVVTEANRTLARARNAIRYARGTQWVTTGCTPKDTVWRQGKASLWRFHSDQVRYQPPVLIFIGLISRSFILDLHPGNSFVEHLRDAGFDVFLLDWGVPDAGDAANTIETYVSAYLPRAVRAIQNATGASEVTMLGYCMGGNFALLAAAGGAVPIRNLVTIATPIAFSELGTLTDALATGRLEPDTLIDKAGNVPGEVFRNFFRVRKPTGDLLQYAILWENLWSEDYIAGHQAMGRWICDQPPVPGAAFRQLVDDWLRPDAFRTDRLRLDGRPVRLQAIRHPTLSVVAMRDEIVPPAAALPIASVLESADLEMLRLDAGHVGLAASRKAVKVTIPAIVRWLTEHSDG